MLKRLRKQEPRNSGATVVEFALIAPILFLLMMGIIEFGLIFFLNVMLQGAVDTASRLGKTGFAPAGVTRDSWLREQIRENMAYDMVNVDDLNISMLWYRGMQDVGQPEPCLVTTCTAGSPPGDFQDINGNGVWDADMGIDGSGGGSMSVAYRVSYDWDIFTPIMREYLGNTITLSSVAIVRNEAFTE